MGVNRLAREAEKRRNPNPLPWIRVPRDKQALAMIVEVLDMIPESESPDAQKFWRTVRAHCYWLMNNKWTNP